MNGNGSSDQLLAHYIAATDGDADEVLGRILMEIVDPVTAQIVRRKLGIRIVGDSNANGSPIHEDGLGVAANVRLAMITALRKARQDPDQNEIDSIEAYATTVARNATNEYLRQRFPARFRLSNQIRYLLKYDLALKTDKRPEGLWIAIAEPTASAAAHIDDQTIPRADELEGLVERYKGQTGVSLGLLVKRLLTDIARPVMFEEVVTAVATIKGIRDAVVADTPIEDLSVSSSDPDPAVRADRKELLAHVWETAQALPLRHRRAVLLHLSDDAGDNMLMMFPLEGIASIRALAACLELDLDVFLALWNDLPLPDAEIAKMMGLKRQQVINLRHSAKGMLKRRLRDAGILQ